MNPLVPEHLNKNEVKRKSLRCSAPVPFVPPVLEIPESKENKHSIKLRINKQTDERVSVFHGGIPEAYLQYIEICENLICKKELKILYQGYEEEENLAQLDMDILGVKSQTRKMMMRHLVKLLSRRVRRRF